MLPLRDHEPSERIPIVTIGLIIANAAVFFLRSFLTSQFLHGGFAHILFNMWYL